MARNDVVTGGEALAAGGDESTTDQLPVHGVILGEDDVTTGLSGKRTRWPGSVLEEMADDGLFVGRPITMADSLDPEQHVGVTVDCDGTDRSITLDGAVSLDEKVGEVTDTAYESGTGLLFEGFIADEEAEASVIDGLAQVSPVLVRDLAVVEDDGGEALYEPQRVAAARDLALVADGAAPSNDIDPGTGAGLDPSTAEALAAAFDTTDPAGDDGTRDTSSQSIRAQSDQFDMELSDTEQELVAAARQTDDPRVVPAAERDRLDDLEAQLDEHSDIIEEAADIDDPQVLSADEAAAMTDRINRVEAMMADVLSERAGLREATVEAMSFEAMAAEFETDDGGFNVEALTQSPETGTTTNGDGDSGPSDAELERIQAIDEKLSTVGSALPDSRIEALQSEAADLADVESYDDAVEVL